MGEDRARACDKDGEGSVRKSSGGEGKIKVIVLRIEINMKKERQVAK